MKNQDKFEKLTGCVYCGSDRFSELLSAPDRFGRGGETFTISKCHKCGLVFQNPRVKESYIDSYYTDDLGYYSPQAENKNTFREKLKSFLTRQALVNHFNYNHLGHKNFLMKILTYPLKIRLKTRLVPTFVPGGRLFEIGCSYGANLKRMKDWGWEVVGLEMNSKSVNHARGLGLEVYLDKVENTDFPKESFDVISMSMVLEHVYNPFKVLDKITPYLKPKGSLIFAIPYFEGLEFSLFKQYSYGLHLPHHITFLNKKIINDYLSKIGYKDIRFYFQDFDRDMVSSAGYKYEETGSHWCRLLSQNKFIRIVFIRPLVYILSLLGRTSRVTVYAEKN